MKKKRIKKKRIARVNKKGKTVVHSDRYWADQELDEWEKEQIRVAYKYLKHNHLKLSRLVDDAKQLSFSLPCLSAEAIEQIENGTYEHYFKGLNVEHLRDSNGNVRYWGDVLDAPKPRLLKNGTRSPEDIILNPGRIKSSYANSKTRSSATMLVKLMRRLGIKSNRIRISEAYNPVAKEQTGDWLLSDAKHGSRKFLSKKAAFKAADQPYSLLTDTRSGEDEEGKYNFKRYRIRIDADKNKFIKLLEVSRDTPLVKSSKQYKEKCKNCGAPIHPLVPALVTSWESVNSCGMNVMRPKSIWCANCEHIGKKLAKKRRTKKRKLRKLEKKQKRNEKRETGS